MPRGQPRVGLPSPAMPGHARARSRAATLVGPVAIALALTVATAGCSEVRIRLGGLDVRPLQAQILEGLRAELPVELVEVTCPEGVQPRAGDVFLCRVLAADGSVGIVEVTQVDDQGNVAWELTDVLDPTEAAGG